MPASFLVLMLVTTVLVALVLMPFMKELLLALVAASVLWPARCWLSARLGDRPRWAALVITVAVVLLLAGPLAIAVTMVVRDGDRGLAFVSNTLHGPRFAAVVAHLPQALQELVSRAVDTVPISIGGLPGAIGVGSGPAAVAVVGSALLHAVLMVVALFFLLLEGDHLVSWIDSISPLRVGQTRELLTTVRRVSYSVVFSALATAAVQSVAALAGYLIADVPSPFFFTVVTFFVAFIPAIGAASVCLVAALLQFASGHQGMAFFLAAWALLVVALVDNIVQPLLTKRGTEVHGAVVFFAFFGGLAAFGAIGILVGPMVVALFLALLRMYHRDFSPHVPREPRVPGL